MHVNPKYPILITTQTTSLTPSDLRLARVVRAVSITHSFDTQTAALEAIELVNSTPGGAPETVVSALALFKPTDTSSPRLPLV